MLAKRLVRCSILWRCQQNVTYADQITFQTMQLCPTVCSVDKPAHEFSRMRLLLWSIQGADASKMESMLCPKLAASQ